MNITTTKKNNHNGTPQILAKGNGKQRTVSYDLSKSIEWNHGNAAGTLALVLFQSEESRKIAAKHAKVIKDTGAKMVFGFGF